MKKLFSVLIIICMVLSLAACGETKTNDESEISENKQEVTFDYESEDLTGYVRLGEYKGLKATKQSDALTEQEYTDSLNALLANYTSFKHMTDSTIVEGDIVIIDYTGFIDGKNFDGGTATNVEVIAGDGNGYIPGFGAALIGHMPGENFSADMTFPDDYDINPDYAGKDVTFNFTVYYIQGDECTPTLDDIDNAFVKKYFGVNTVEEFLVYQREKIALQKAYSVVSAMNLELWQQVLNHCEIIAYPEELTEATYQQYRDEYEYYASYYGTDYETYLEQNVGITDDGLVEECKDIVKEDLVMYAMMKELDVAVSDADVESKISSFAEMYGVSNDEIIGYYGEDGMKKTALYDKILEIVASYGEITEIE